jgi:hypothetical protein
MYLTGSATPRLDVLGPILTEGFQYDDYVAHRIFAPLAVEKRTGAIPSFLLTNDQILSVKHSPKTAYKRIFSSLGEKTYSCQEDGLEEPLSREDFEILSRSGAEAAVANRLVHSLLRARDYSISQAFFSATGEATFTGQVTTAGANWDTATGDPYANISDALEAIGMRVGGAQVSMVIGWGAYTKLKKNAKVQSAYRNVLGYTDRKGIELEIPVSTLATIFGLKNVYIARGIYNSANEGLTASRSFLFPSTYAMLFVESAGGQTANEMCTGRMFNWDLSAKVSDLVTGTADALRAVYLEGYSDVTIDAEILRARDYIDMKVLVPESVQLIKSI